MVCVITFRYGWSSPINRCPNLRGEIKLGIRYQSQHDGYSLERNGYVRADASDNDLYFFSKEGVDYLGSPKRLNGFLNDNHFLILPYSGEFAHVSARLMESELTATEDLVEIALGDWILLQRADGRNALMKVLSVDDLGQKRSVMLFFAYSTLMGEIFF